MAVQSCSPQLACVPLTETTNEAGNSVIVTLASSEHVLPEIETVTVYVPAASPVAVALVPPDGAQK